MHKVTIDLGTREAFREFDTFAKAVDFSQDVMRNGFRAEFADDGETSFWLWPAASIKSVKIEEIKTDDRKEKQRSEVAEGKQRKRRG